MPPTCYDCTRWSKRPGGPTELVPADGLCRINHGFCWPATSTDRACDAFDPRQLPLYHGSMANPRVIFMLMFDCPLGSMC
ncbi:MAG: hypothetical protein KKE29_20085 [Proteobacteria bacterium]|nr:hypothetical protein [Pseudomonadota bacterium]MBU4576023.1 hypothetical protein [Pseudomonadota bacterium]MBV1715989.1 hypothetical protein [Desulfarculus sp.]